ncbi:hypothetical protein KFK09_028536 [Dendrobium nobile]|uniref:Uncharacterized protein n=1 Tax=Dendrobium nobile TaxID=94219 RepID=A0A8T3A3C7_DENNO|nr:hypothetical protein KFK09_028536 [Dendrobium nobile]
MCLTSAQNNLSTWEVIREERSTNIVASKREAFKQWNIAQIPIQEATDMFINLMIEPTIGEIFIGRFK